ncbi:MAG: heterodisulfide reductase [Methanosarcinales archaeon]|nr:heterodisulfide reductase [Methanosarcinales archaeon]
MDAQFKEEVLKLAGDEVKNCIQCGTCSSSCSTAHLMDNSIRKLVRFVLEGMKEEALSSQSIWLCTSCLLCTVRCPRSIRPKSVVAALKHIKEQEGGKNKDQAFEEMFMRQIRDCGRVSEFLLSAGYPLANPMATVQIMTMGIELLPKGKIDFHRDCVRGQDEIKRIFEELKEG